MVSVRELSWMVLTYLHTSRRNFMSLRPSTALIILLLALFAAMAQPLLADERYEAKVNVDVDKVRNVMAFRALAVDSTLWDENLTKPETSQLLRAIGVTTVRFPGASANRYHWASHTGTPVHGSDTTKPQYFSSSTNFGQFARMLDQLGGTAVITVNYGTNMAGNGGGEPAEAAAWVAYANGDPSEMKVIGKDSTGYDWKTVGYWAGIRAAAPLATDDGFNFLRISHPQPLKIKHWEIGNEVFSNGYYAKDGKIGTEEDLHAPYGKDDKESEKLRNHNAKLSPAAYGEAVVEFAKAMKAVDPTIKIGASLATPPVKGAFAQAGAAIEHSKDDATYNAKRLAGSGGWLSGVADGSLKMDDSQDWNRGVMKACASVIDFVAVHWSFGKFLPPDYKTPDGTGTLTAPYTDLPQVVTGIVDLATRFGGSNARNIQMAFTGLAAWGTEKDQTLQALFLTESYMSLIESGSLATVGTEAHGQGFLDGTNKPGPLAYALGMIHIVARPNDTVVDSESSSTLLGAHTAKRADGSLGLMLINKDASKTANVKVALKGAKVGAKGMRFDFGKNTNGLPVKGAADIGESFTIEVPPFTVVDVLLPKAQ